MKIGILVFSAFLAATTSRAELGFSFSFDEQVPFGNDLRWCVSVTNATETTGTVAVAFSVDWLQYNGEVLASVSEFATTSAVSPSRRIARSFRRPKRSSVPPPPGTFSTKTTRMSN